MTITVADFATWLQKLDQNQPMFIFDHFQRQEVPFEPDKHIDIDKQNGRVVIDI